MQSETKVESGMKQDQRSIVRKRTQQLVYLELGRDNGGVMLNLSEEGCAFQAISPVKLGKTRFAFQISGGRRIAGDAEVQWTDEAGIMGGLQFLDLEVEAGKQIRMWLNDTNAPEEPGEGVMPAADAPLDAVSRGPRKAKGRVATAEAMPATETRQNSWPDNSVRAMGESEMAPPWAHMPVNEPPVLEDVRARFPLLREDPSYSPSRTRSAALWRGIAFLAMGVAAAALLYVYQQDVGSSLISLGEVLTGRAKTSAVAPESKPVEQVKPPADVAAAPEKTEADAAPKKEPEPARAEELDTVKQDAAIESAERPESVLEPKGVRQKVERARSESESVASLWEGVQSGSVAAEMSLAERFARGDGVARNCDQARILLKAAAGKGNREARLRLYQLESGSCQ
jgi:hypothetical protein